MLLFDPNITSIAVYNFDPAACVQFGVHFSLYTKTILNFRTDAQTLIDIGNFMNQNMVLMQNKSKLLQYIIKRIKLSLLIFSKDLTTKLGLEQQLIQLMLLLHLLNSKMMATDIIMHFSFKSEINPITTQSGITFELSKKKDQMKQIMVSQSSEISEFNCRVMLSQDQHGDSNTNKI